MESTWIYKGTNWDSGGIDGIALLGSTSTNASFARPGKVNIYPNPAADYIRVDGGLNGTLIIYNLSGQPVFQKAFFADETISLPNLAQGLYMVNVIDLVGNNYFTTLWVK